MANEEKNKRPTFKVGDRVKLIRQRENGLRMGCILFLGPVHFASGTWVGVELDTEEGVHDGVVKGKRYFQCPPNKGLMCTASMIQHCTQEDEALASMAQLHLSQPQSQIEFLSMELDGHYNLAEEKYKISLRNNVETVNLVKTAASIQNLREQISTLKLSRKPLPALSPTKPGNLMNLSVTFVEEALAFLRHLQNEPAVLSSAEFIEFITLPKTEDSNDSLADQVCTWLSRGQTMVNMSFDDFELLKLLGEGSVGKVFLARQKATGNLFALKVLLKSHIIGRGEEKWVQSERSVLENVHSPFLVNLHFAFQTRDRLVLGLDFVNGGDLFHYVQNHEIFSEERVAFYAACIAIALHELHSNGVIYRDLKPENIMFDSQGYIRLTDFGMCKQNMSKFMASTVCGTPEYVAPDVLCQKPYDHMCDYWSLGIVCYELLVGDVPFASSSNQRMYQKILSPNFKVAFPSHISRHAVSFLKGLLERNPEKRLRYGDSPDIRAHPFLANIDFEALKQRKIAAPWKPNITGADDVSCFDTEFTSQKPFLPPVAVSDSWAAHEHFPNYTFDAERFQQLASERN
eukprot:GCRY01002603.1.p1 GENE.GCRY01002603.1~~GCRY01002603.1.p1  ORF type:complete len:573 (+),score=100.87 GCRY01002603.1:172-1890(+)